jgi:hypothetical protein
MRTIIIDGKSYEWRTIRQLRRDQINEARRLTQLQLFEMRTDARPASERTAAGRLLEPSLFSK